MKKKYYQLTIIFFLILLYFGIFCFPNLIIESGITALTIFKEKLFPSIFPFFVLSFLMLELNITDTITMWLSPFFQILFHTSRNATFILLMSIISGFPSGSKYIANLYQKGEITKEEGNYLLTFTHYANPLFVLGTCGAILESANLAFIIFFCQLFSNLLLGFFLRPKQLLVSKKQKTKKEASPFFVALTEAINKAMEVLLFMLGSITFFLFFSKVLLSFLPNQHLLQIILTGLLDLTSGISMTTQLTASLFFHGFLILMFLTFGSFSVHLQVINAIRKTNLSYQKFLIGRFLQMGIACFLYLILYQLFG